MAPLKSYKPLRRKKWLTAKTRLKRTTANPAKRVVAAKKARKAKGPSARSQQRFCDGKFSEIARTIIGCCEMCRRQENLQIHHLIGRRAMWYRYDPENVMCLCATCHFIAEQNPALFLNTLALSYPERMVWLDIYCHRVHPQSWRAAHYRLVREWLLTLTGVTTPAELRNAPTWQQVNGLEIDNEQA